MTTIIRSNGSHWMGEEPDSIEKLIEVLKSHPLERRHLSCGDYIQTNPIWVHSDFNTVDEETGQIVKCYIASDEQPEKGAYCFSGNFFDLSHVFDIYTTDKRVIRKLTKAIEENLKRPDFLSQPEPHKRDTYFVSFKGEIRRF